MEQKMQLVQNRARHVCNVCSQPGHIARDCNRCICNFCGIFGHHSLRCREREAFRGINLMFVDSAQVHCMVATDETRNLVNQQMHQFWVTLKAMQATNVNGVPIRRMGNGLQIEISRPVNIVFSLKMPQYNRETLIYFNKYRTKIAQKYIIEGSRFIEEQTLRATGNDDLVVPAADIYITLVADDLFKTIVCLQLNERSFYLQWRPVIEDGVPRYAVYVSTHVAFSHEQRMKDRAAILIPREYYFPPPPAAIESQPIERQQVVVAESNQNQPPVEQNENVADLIDLTQEDDDNEIAPVKTEPADEDHEEEDVDGNRTGETEEYMSVSSGHESDDPSRLVIDENQLQNENSDKIEATEE